MKRKLLPRILITLLGKALILWGAGRIALGIIGEPENEPISNLANILTVSATPLRCPTAKK
jgi:hypothetical protein